MVDFPIEAVEIKKKLKVWKSFGENVCSHGHAQSIIVSSVEYMIGVDTQQIPMNWITAASPEVCRLRSVQQ